MLPIGEGIKLVYLMLILIIEREGLYLETMKVYHHVWMDVSIFQIFSEDCLQNIF